MAFDIHEIVRPKNLPVTISLRMRKAGVDCYLSVRADELKSISGNEKTGFDVLIGKDEDAGKLRLRVSRDGKIKCRNLKKGGFIFHLGHVAAFPNSEIDKQRCNAVKVDASTLEIALPDWNALIAQASDEPPSDPPRPVPAQASSAPAKSSVAVVNGGGGGASSIASPSFSRNGITIDLRNDEEAISYKKKKMKITTRQAAVLVALLRGAPSCIGREFLMTKVLVDMPAHMREASLDMIATDLKKALAGIDLDLKIVKGVGLALVAQ